MPPKRLPEDALQIAIYKIKTTDAAKIKVAIEKSGLEMQSLNLTEIDGFSAELYYQQRPAPPKWKGFLRPLVKADQEVLKEDKSWMEGFVLILIHKTNGNIYAATGGPGFFAIQNHIDPDFGMDVFARLLKKEDKVLKAAREKGVVGSVLGLTRHFRRSSTLHEIDSFGKIYQELKASLRKDILIDKLGFSQDDLKKDSICIAKSSFRINKAVSLAGLIKIIKGCETILETEQPVPINSVEKVSAKRDSALIRRLEQELFVQLWSRFSNPDDSFSFDLCDEDFEKYLTASKYEVRKGLSSKVLFQFEELQDIETLFQALRSSPENPTTEAVFVDVMKSIKIFSLDDNDLVQTAGGVLDHLLGDVSHDGKRYFLLDRSWFQIKEAFITDLNARCRALIARNYYAGLTERWDRANESENQYNAKHIGKAETIVLDKITPENIEPCDILKWDAERLYLIHVKAGFGNTMRDLCSQINIAAHRLNADVVASKDYVRKIYHELKNKIGGEPYFDEAGKQTAAYSEEAFVALFDKKLVFVLAVLDTKATERDIREPERFNSNIAKFSLHELSKSIRGLEVEFQISQIHRPMSAGGGKRGSV